MWLSLHCSKTVTCAPSVTSGFQLAGEERVCRQHALHLTVAFPVHPLARNWVAWSHLVIENVRKCDFSSGQCGFKHLHKYMNLHDYINKH